MALYINHDFAHNYKAYTEAKEYDLRNDMLIDEIAKMLTFDLSGLKLAVVKSGFRIKREPKHKEWVSFFKNYIPRNKALRENISKLIIVNNTKGIKDKHNAFVNFSNDDEDNKAKAKKNNREVSLLSNGIKESFMNVEGASGLENKAYQHEKNKKVISGDYDKEIKRKMRNAFIRGAVISTVVLVGGRYLIRRYNIMDKIFARGGSVDEPTLPLQPQQPTVAPQQDMTATQNDIPMQQAPTQQGLTGDMYDEHGFKIN